jgi:hypothetical protein
MMMELTRQATISLCESRGWRCPANTGFVRRSNLCARAATAPSCSGFAVGQIGEISAPCVVSARPVVAKRHRGGADPLRYLRF